MKFVYTVRVEVVLTEEEVKLLVDLSAKHYDGHCRSVSESGGFLNGMRNSQAFSPVLPHTLKFREIDTLCKILEAPTHDGATQKVADALAHRLHACLKAINVEHGRLNAV